MQQTDIAPFLAAGTEPIGSWRCCLSGNKETCRQVIRTHLRRPPGDLDLLTAASRQLPHLVRSRTIGRNRSICRHEPAARPIGAGVVREALGSPPSGRLRTRRMPSRTGVKRIGGHPATSRDSMCTWHRQLTSTASFRSHRCCTQISNEPDRFEAGAILCRQSTVAYGRGVLGHNQFCRRRERTHRLAACARYWASSVAPVGQAPLP
jgi:hypothetical protein